LDKSIPKISKKNETDKIIISSLVLK